MLWILQPVYIIAEIVVGLQASADYSFARSTVSDLGNTSCREVRCDLLCSPWHAGMNSAFIWFGCTLALGALLFGTRLFGMRLFGARHLTGLAGRASVALWCISGLGSIGVGLFPVNEDPMIHGLVALPIFIAQPAALLLMGISLRASHPRLARGSFVVAALSIVGAAGFGLVVGSDASTVGAFERLALWPGYIWVSVVAVVAVSSLVGRDAEDRARREVQ